MQIDHPASCHIPGLRALWKTAFGDPDAFLDSFFETAFVPEHCLCSLEDGIPAAMLYWIDCTLGQQKLAYIYAVATDPAFRGRGLCRNLMTAAHSTLTAQGYAAAVLVPQQEGLRAMYASMGYQNCGGMETLSCTAEETPAAVRAVGPGEFAALRRRMLPEGAVVQEGSGLAFLATQLQFYAGDGFLLAAFREKDMLHGAELLGDPAAAPGILAALGCREGRFRIPGSTPFAMWHPLTAQAARPGYFGFAFD